MKRVLVIGGVPPPIVGPTERIALLLKGFKPNHEVVLELYDIVDRRSVENMGRFDLQNVALAISHCLGLIKKLSREKYFSVFLSLAQNRWGFIRDSILIWISRCWKVKIIIHLDGGRFRHFYEHQGFFFRTFIAATCKQINAAVALSESLKSNLDGLVRNVEVIHAGVPLIRAEVKQRAARGRVKRVLFLSNLVRSKGYLEVLRSIPYVVAKNREVVFVFVGKEIRGADDPRDYNVEQERKDLVARLQIEDFVQFLGPLFNEKRDEEFNNSDIFVFPTYYVYEGMPAVVLQAMSAELPVIVSRFPGAIDLVKDGFNGYFVDPFDHKEIAEKILILLSDDTLREQMGLRNSSLIREQFSTEEHIQKTIEILSR